MILTFCLHHLLEQMTGMMP